MNSNPASLTRLFAKHLNLNLWLLILKINKCSYSCEQNYYICHPFENIIIAVTLVLAKITDRTVMFCKHFISVFSKILKKFMMHGKISDSILEHL